MNDLPPKVAAALKGMLLAATAGEAPDRLAIVAPDGDRTFAELNGRANQLAKALRAGGFQARDGIAILVSNRAEFAEALYAGLRIGARITPINWHLTGEEVGYIVDDCEAKVLIADAQFASVARTATSKAAAATTKLSVGGSIDGFDNYEAVLAANSPDDIDDPALGSTMLYTSGTTGRPKGVYRADTAATVARTSLATAIGETARMDPTQDVSLCTGPLYHAAPLAFSLVGPLAAGLTVVLMESFSAEELLRQVEQHRVTHTHVVPTMFHRLVALPADVRAKYDVSSLRYIVHGAAPCPVHVKQAVMDWLGPVVYEYYAATEGGGVFITPDEWLRKPGAVGIPPVDSVAVLDDAGQPCAVGDIGTVYFRAPDRGRFEYFKAPEKTASAYRDDLFTLGDMGYIDADGYLFLTGRSAELIISGGVNIYPAEVDAVLLEHPSVGDVATVGVPNLEWGEEVKAVVEPAAGIEPSEALAAELLEHTRARLARFKCPRSIDFVTEIPRSDAGKVYRRRVRDWYWPESGPT